MFTYPVTELQLPNFSKVAKKLNIQNAFLPNPEHESRQTGTLGFYGTPRPSKPAENFFSKTPTISRTFDIYAIFEIYSTCHFAG